MDSEDGCSGNNTTEAFALLLVSNNYKAWMYEEKRSHGNELLTEYDTLPSVAAVSIVDKLLVDQEIVLETGAEEMVVRNTTSERFP
jgi:hypothetical protein